ncbi:hypothetical protein CRG98_049495 [Punica granatum]|nr:hypothetical protein CRG98_049495 [Punica granatum]
MTFLCEPPIDLSRHRETTRDRQGVGDLANSPGRINPGGRIWGGLGGRIATGGREPSANPSRGSRVQCEPSRGIAGSRWVA